MDRLGESPHDRIQKLLAYRFDRGEGIFAKLQQPGEPYRFVEWKLDRHDQRCLYYEFDGRDPDSGIVNEKRVPVEELVAAVIACGEHGYLDRKVFAKYCPVAHSAGDCGYAVTGRCLELLDIAKHEPERHRFELTNEARAKLLSKYE